MTQDTDLVDTSDTETETSVEHGPDLAEAGLYGETGSDGIRYTILAHYTEDQKKKIGKERPAGSEVMRAPTEEVWRTLHAAGWGVVTGGFTYWWAAGKAKVFEPEPETERGSASRSLSDAHAVATTFPSIDATDTSTFVRSLLRIAGIGATIPETLLAPFRSYARIEDGDHGDEIVLALKKDLKVVLDDIDAAQEEGRVWNAVTSESKSASAAFRRLCRLAYKVG